MATLFADVAATSAAIAATTSRSAKRDAVAGLLRRLAPDEVPVVVAMLAGELRQGRIGVGWATVAALSVAPAAAPSLTVVEVDRVLAEVAAAAGSGSQATRRDLLARLLGQATPAEADLLRRLLTGEVRQGALAGVVADGVARAAGVPPAAVRRAVLLGGDLGGAAAAALGGGESALAAIGLTVLRPLQPMLAATAPAVADALAEVGEASVEWKLDGARIQVHRVDDEVRVFTRNLNDVTHRLPEVVAVVASLPCRQAVLDGEVLGLDADARPRAFQDTMSRFGAAEAGHRGLALAPFFFDVLHLDGDDLVDEPLGTRRDVLAGLAPANRVPGTVTADPDEAARVLDEALARGHEGVMVKAVTSTYEAGRRGRSWRKVKPVHTLDLVVLAAEWGHGRRRGWLSNLHLGARRTDGAGFMMVGKTFKGLTDEVLGWQTTELLARQVDRDGSVVLVRPELVVEVALDGVQASSRYPGGVALRFARVRRYRPDKSPADADTIDRVLALLRR